MLSRMWGSVSFGFVVSWGVRVVSRIRVPGSSFALFEAQPAVQSSPTKMSRRIVPP